MSNAVKPMFNMETLDPCLEEGPVLGTMTEAEFQVQFRHLFVVWL